MKISINSPVVLSTFLGKLNCETEINESENYWKLIGQVGRVLEVVDKNTVLVQFYNNLSDFKIENHNPIKNTLIIKKADLKIDKYAKYKQNLKKEILLKSSFMNDSKWFKLFQNLEEKNIKIINAKYKILGDNTIRDFYFPSEFNKTGFLDGAWSCGTTLFKEIEWILMKSKVVYERKNRSETLQAKIEYLSFESLIETLDSLGNYEYETDEHELKIFGYK